MLAHHNLSFKPYGGWRVRLVKKGLFDNAVHMDARFNGKDICAQHSLVVGYVKARLREQFGFEGTPLVLIVRKRGEEEEA